MCDHSLKPNTFHLISVSLAEHYFHHGLIVSKFHITTLEMTHYRTHSNRSTKESKTTPSSNLLSKYISRFRNSHPDYKPMDVDSIKWLTDRLSFARFLSLSPDACPAAMSFLNSNLPYLRTLRNIIKFGKTKYGDDQLEGTTLFAKMKWMEEFKFPELITDLWFRVNGILHNVQSSIPMEQYLKHNEWYDQWFSMLHNSWQHILTEVRIHLFFRQFRCTKHIPRFQHSVQWTIFFDLFQTNEDSEFLDILELKDRLLFSTQFREGIRDFIDAVETVLDEVKYVERTPMNISGENLIYNDQLNAEAQGILQSLSPSNSYERWISDLFGRSTDVWIITLADAADGDPVPFPKEIVAARMLVDLEEVVAYIEPIVFGIRKIHRMLWSFRKKMRLYIHQLILEEAWISDT